MIIKRNRERVGERRREREKEREKERKTERDYSGLYEKVGSGSRKCGHQRNIDPSHVRLINSCSIRVIILDGN